MKKLIFLLLPILALALTGCVTGKGWQGLIPGKDAEFQNVKILLSTPWGTETFTADRIATRVDNSGSSSNNLPPLGPSTQTVVPATVPNVQLVPAQATGPRGTPLQTP